MDDASGSTWMFYRLWNARNPVDFTLLKDTSCGGEIPTQRGNWTAATITYRPHIRHTGSINVVFGDGHVESASEERFVQAYRSGMVSGNSAHNLYLWGGRELEDIFHSVPAP